MRPRAASPNEVPQSSAYRRNRSGTIGLRGENEDESVAPEHVGPNLANYYLDELGFVLVHLKSARKKGHNVQKVGMFQGGHLVGALQRIMSTKQISRDRSFDSFSLKCTAVLL